MDKKEEEYRNQGRTLRNTAIDRKGEASSSMVTDMNQAEDMGVKEKSEKGKLK